MGISSHRVGLALGVSLLSLAAPSFAQVVSSSTPPHPGYPATSQDTVTSPAAVADATANGQTGSNTAEADAPSSADIVVTAQNRTQRLQDVPIAINVVSSDQLNKQNVVDVQGLTRVDPSVQLNATGNQTFVSVRGVGTRDNGEAQDTSVAVNVDGEYINRPNFLNSAIFDIERVEVLRGPQGTLQGRNATAGALNFITKKPSFDFGGDASVSYGNYNQLIAQAGINLPVGQTLSFRIAGLASDRGKGYTYHPNVDVRTGDQHLYGGRLSTRYEPTSDVRIDLAGEYSHSKTFSNQEAYVDLTAAGNGPGAGCSQNGFSEYAPLVPGVQCVPSGTNFLARVDRGAYNAALTYKRSYGSSEVETYAVRGRVSYDFNVATLTYTGGYRHGESSGFNPTAPNFVTYNYGTNVDTQSHELRLNGNQSIFNWQVGAFYFDEKLDTTSGLFSPFIGANGTYINFFKRPDPHTQSYAAFGQTDIRLTDTLSAVGGVRYTKNDRSATFQNYSFLFNSGPAVPTGAPTQTLNLKSSDDKVTWLAGLNYKPSQRTLVYGKVSTGFKAGGYDTNGAYKPETNTAYELGTKLQFGERGQHIFDLTGFYYDYKDLQTSVLLNAAVGAQTFNAGSATVYGIEAQSTFALSPNDHFNASVNYLHTKYDDLLISVPVISVSGSTLQTIGDLGGGVNGAIVQPSLAGTKLPNSPAVTIYFSYEHVFELGSAGTVTANAGTRFKSAFFLDPFNYRDERQTAFTQSDINISYQPPSERFSIQGFVQNLENYRPLTYAAFTIAGPAQLFRWSFGTPRTYGVRVTTKF